MSDPTSPIDALNRNGGLRWVCVTDIRNFPKQDVNPAAPSLLASASGNTITIGPVYVDGKGICANCVRHWANTAGWNRPPAPEASSRALDVLKAMMAEIEEQFQRGTLAGEWFRTIREIDVETGHSRKHSLVPRADCPHCGVLHDPSLPLTTHCGPLTGIVSSLTVTSEPIAGSYSAVGQYAAPLPVTASRPGLKPQISLGKGPSRQQAIDSCIGEALERYSLIYTGREPLLRRRLGEVPAVDPRHILLFSDRQDATRDSWNAVHDGRYWVPEQFDPGTPLDLMPGRDLASGETVYVPAACCLMWYPFRRGEPRFASADSIGCAAGADLCSATAAALLEWIERDALAIWWYNRVRRPAAAVESFESAPLDRIQSALRREHRDLCLIDIANDVRIPSYVAVSPARDGTEPLFASAAHPSPREAALRAASEVAQLIFLTIHSGGLDPEIHAWLNSATLETRQFLVPSGWSTPPPEPGPLRADEVVERCLRALNATGLRPVVVDHSRPDVLAKTARVVVPGLRHIWARFAPGRLYDVPVRLGWLPEPLTEDSLNSILCMI